MQIAGQEFEEQVEYFGAGVAITRQGPQEMPDPNFELGMISPHLAFDEHEYLVVVLYPR